MLFAKLQVFGDEVITGGGKLTVSFLLVLSFIWFGKEYIAT
jgi:hypothetical protein